MESRDLDMNDLFDNDVGVDDDLDDVGAAPMPGLDDEAEEAPMNEDDEDGEDGEEGEGGDVLAKLKALKRGAAKKRVLRPQPKLDATRLKSDRGLPILPKLFESVKFKGKGHEANDLKMMMSKLEHWGHRLFPKMTFDELIARMEKLGQKKDVQTCLKRIRLDMPVLDDDFASANMYESDENDEQPPVTNNQEVDDFDAEEAYDEMIRQEKEAMERRKQQEMDDEELMTSQTPGKTPAKSLASLTSDQQEERQIIPVTPAQNLPATPDTNGMTPEQKERIERNKLKALEKRAAKLGVPVSSLMPSSTNTPIRDTNGVPNGPSKSPGDNTPNQESPQAVNSEEATMNREEATMNGEEAAVNGEKATVNNAAATSKTDDVYQTEDEILNAVNSDEENDTCKDRAEPKIQPDHTPNSTRLENDDRMDAGDNENCAQAENWDSSRKIESEGSLNLVLSDTEAIETHQSENIGTLKLSGTESGDTENIANTHSSEAGHLSNTNEDGEIQSEEEKGLRLELSDSTNTTQEEEDMNENE